MSSYSDYYYSFRRNRLPIEAQKEMDNWEVRNPSLHSKHRKTDIPKTDLGVPTCSGPDFVYQGSKLDFNNKYEPVRVDRSIKFRKFRDKI
jgi:hypothetical protein